METIILRTQNRVYQLATTDIISIESSSNYSIIYLSNGKRIVVAKVLHALQEVVGSQFIRINRSQLINTCLVRSINKHSCSITLMNNQKFFISRRRKKLILATV